MRRTLIISLAIIMAAVLLGGCDASSLRAEREGSTSGAAGTTAAAPELIGDDQRPKPAAVSGMAPDTNASETTNDADDWAEDRDDQTAASFTYERYTPEAQAAAAARGDETLLFFHAEWCPTCKAAERSFDREGAELLSGVTVLQVDYDSATELRRQYDVAVQHTLVQIDPSSGSKLQFWIGGDAQTIAEQLQDA